MHWQKHIRIAAIVGLSLVAFCVGLFFLREHRSPPRQRGGATTTLRTFTLGELAVYNGASTTLPIYIGLDGYVYDVTAGKKFYIPGATYHYLAGNDSSKSLHIMGGETIKQKYPIVGILEK